MRGKQWMVLLMALMLTMFAVTGQAATIWFDKVDLARTVVGVGTTSWQHDMPLDLQVPPLSNIVSAKLDIFYSNPFGGAYISANGDIVGNILSFKFWQSGLDKAFDITAALVPWTQGTPFLNVDVTGAGGVYFAKSELTIDYNPVPAPEPSTMILLGSGLVGLAGWGRKKFRK